MATGGASETRSASDIERGTDETFDQLCSPCSRRNKNTEGSKYCTDCEDYFCSTCVNWHNDFPAIRNHQILDKAKLLQIKNSKKYSVSEKSERYGCDITSVCELDDGTIILSDATQKKLKRLDSSFYMIRDSCRVPSIPQQVCIINSQEVAVCCYWDKLIQFVSIGHTMQTTRQIETGLECSGLAYNDDKLFISDDISSVYVYTITGERLKQLCLPSVKFGYLNKVLYGICFTRIAVSKDGSTIYIAHYTKGLIIVNRNGQLVREFTDLKLSGARGVGLLNDNSVLLCGWDSKNVLQFTTDGKLIGEVLKRNRHCSALCYCKKTSKLIIAYDGIEVYDIKE